MIKAAAIFTDNMVLQRDKNIEIFGYTDEEEISASINEINVSAEVKGNRWNAVFPPMQAGGPYTLTIKGSLQTIVYNNVMIGEVWLAGGQSNMEFELQNELHGKETLENINEDNTNVRYYYTPKQNFIDEDFYLTEEKTCWQTAGRDNSKNWSAVGFYFADMLSKKLGVTVGIIGCNWGGSSASAWMSRKFLNGIDEIASYIEDYEMAVAGKTREQMIEEYDRFCDYDKEWNIRSQKCYAENPDISWDDVQKICGKNLWPGPMGIKNPFRICGMHETMISRIAPYTLRGFLYYQGEEDDRRPDSYYALLRRLIECWRWEWHDDELPFMLVQLPMFMYKGDTDRKNWCKIREAQMRIFKTVKNTGIAVISDCGEYGDIHPINKKPVGERLFLQALYHVYGFKDADAFGPIYRTHSYRGDGINIILDNAENGIMVIGSPDGFEIAGADKKFYRAKAEINGNSIFIRSDNVKKPKYARYAWTNYMEVKIFGRNGIPLAPFRTHTEDE